MGDFNCELQRNVEGYTGQWCTTQRKDNGHGEEILVLMRSFDLFAVDTLFKPQRKVWGKDGKMHYCNVTHGKERGEEAEETRLYLCFQSVERNDKKRGDKVGSINTPVRT